MKVLRLVAVGSAARVGAWLRWWLRLRINAGAVAGQTIAHPHVHLISRYAGDGVDPRDPLLRWP